MRAILLHTFMPLDGFRARIFDAPRNDTLNCKCAGLFAATRGELFELQPGEAGVEAVGMSGQESVERGLAADLHGQFIFLSHPSLRTGRGCPVGRG